MFRICKKFNQPLDEWDVSQVTNMQAMFKDCVNFNQPLDGWNVSQVTNMEAMFKDCVNFNQPLDEWDVSRVTNMKEMFKVCKKFNERLDGWDVGEVTNMETMFKGCVNFNQPLNRWDVSQVTNMNEMFMGCENFNQPLNGWDVNLETTDVNLMFYDCNKFNPFYKPKYYYGPKSRLKSFKEYKQKINDLRIPLSTKSQERKLHDLNKEKNENSTHQLIKTRTTPYLAEDVLKECNGETKDILTHEKLRNLKTIVLSDHQCYRIDTLAALHNNNQRSKSLFTQLPFSQRDKEIMELCSNYEKAKVIYKNKKRKTRSQSSSSQSKSKSKSRGGKRHTKKKY
jgi:surface protein